MTVSAHFLGACIRAPSGEIIGTFASVSEAWEARREALRLAASINTKVEV